MLKSTREKIMRNCPSYVTVNGVKYPINTDFRVALECLQIVDDTEIGDAERAYAVVYKLFDVISDDNELIAKLLLLACKYLRCGEDEKEQQARQQDMDFEQDEGAIYASFMSDYHIDLSTVNLHWYRFVDLLQGLTDKCVLSRTRELRTFDLSEIKDTKIRDKIAQAQQAVALKRKRTKEEKEAIDKFNALF